MIFTLAKSFLLSLSLFFVTHIAGMNSSNNYAIVPSNNQTHFTDDDLAQYFPQAFINMSKRFIELQKPYANELLSHPFYATEMGKQSLPELLTTALNHDNVPVACTLHHYYQQEEHSSLIRTFCYHVISIDSECKKSATITALITLYRHGKSLFTQEIMRQLLGGSYYYNDDVTAAKIIDAFAAHKA